MGAWLSTTAELANPTAGEAPLPADDPLPSFLLRAAAGEDASGQATIGWQQLIERMTQGQDDLVAEVRHLQQLAAAQEKRLVALQEENSALVVQLELLRLQKSAASAAHGDARLIDLSRKLETLEDQLEHLQKQVHNKQKDDTLLRTTINDLQSQIDLLEFGPSERMKKVAGSIGSRTNDTLRRKKKDKRNSVSFATLPATGTKTTEPIVISDDVDYTAATATTTTTTTIDSAATVEDETQQPVSSDSAEQPPARTGLRSWAKRPMTAATHLSQRMADSSSTVVDDAADTADASADGDAAAQTKPPAARRRALPSYQRYQRRFPDPVVPADDDTPSDASPTDSPATPSTDTTETASIATPSTEPEAAAPAPRLRSWTTRLRRDTLTTEPSSAASTENSSAASTENSSAASTENSTADSSTPSEAEQPAAAQPRLRNWTTRLRRDSTDPTPSADSPQ